MDERGGPGVEVTKERRGDSRVATFIFSICRLYDVYSPFWIFFFLSFWIFFFPKQ